MVPVVIAMSCDLATQLLESIGQGSR